jgi:hypothetical protein
MSSGFWVVPASRIISAARSHTGRACRKGSRSRIRIAAFVRQEAAQGWSFCWNVDLGVRDGFPCASSGRRSTQTPGDRRYFRTDEQSDRGSFDSAPIQFLGSLPGRQIRKPAKDTAKPLGAFCRQALIL